MPGSDPPTTALPTLRPFQSIPRYQHAIMQTLHTGAGGRVELVGVNVGSCVCRLEKGGILGTLCGEQVDLSDTDS